MLKEYCAQLVMHTSRARIHLKRIQPADSMGLASSPCRALPIALAAALTSPFFFVRAPWLDIDAAGLPARRCRPMLGRAVEMSVPQDLGMPARRRSSACAGEQGLALAASANRPPKTGCALDWQTSVTQTPHETFVADSFCIQNRNVLGLLLCRPKLTLFDLSLR